MLVERAVANTVITMLSSLQKLLDFIEYQKTEVKTKRIINVIY